MRTSMAALVAECGNVWDVSFVLPNIPAFRNLQTNFVFVS